MLAELIAGKVERGSVFICLVMVVVVVKLALCPVHLSQILVAQACYVRFLLIGCVALTDT